MNFKVIIIGGGLAGLTSAIHLSKNGIEVLLIEKNEFPKHKVCGEYISNEVLPYLQSLGVNPIDFGAVNINRFMLSTTNGKSIESKLPLGGFGISRYLLDNILVKKALKNGVTVLQDTVLDVQYLDNEFIVITKNNFIYQAKIVIGAHGKRANLDIQFKRSFIKNKSPFLAVKTHLKTDFPNDLVALHNFNGGYCGVSKVENDTVNVCYITDFKSFKKYKNIQDFQEKVVYKNKYLKTIFKNSESVFEKPLTISQISFSSKKPVENHVLMCGDSAGMIHPLCGNGMSMAIRSAKIISELIIDYLNGKIVSKSELEKIYTNKWNAEFKTRLKVGHVVASFFERKYLTGLALYGLQSFPNLLPRIIKQTHGKTMQKI
jgi:flavin-dependent dehydrogenase